MKISDHTIQEVKRVSLVEIIGQFVHLKRQGSQYRGLCPFHDERTSSFYVTPGMGYKCFGCDASGNNVVDFIMKYEAKTFVDAMNKVAGMAGIQIEQNEEYGIYQNPTFNISSPTPSPISFIPSDLFKGSLKHYETNNMVKYLFKLFNHEDALELVTKYCIGTSNHRFTNKNFPGFESDPGASVFWQVDINGNTRTGKMLQINPSTGKRVREPFPHITWVHRVMNLPGFNLKQCFFGENLLKDKGRTVGIVESEKTALIASGYYPEYLWIACGGLSNLNTEKCRVLVGRNVVMFPDKGGYELWEGKAKELSSIARFKVSDLLERKNAEPKSDIADYLVKYDYREFRQDKTTGTENKSLAPIDILIENITSIPCEVITGAEFKNTSIAWIKTDKEGDFEVLFDHLGNPCTEIPLIENIGDAYKKEFKQVLLNNKQAYAHINGME